jgi:uncharacterized small protein (DUF1192 family)
MALTIAHAGAIFVNQLGSFVMAVDPEELEPKKQKPKPHDLEGLGVAELQDYIADLEAEIARAKAAIAKKQDHKSGAEAFFNKR